jgi:uncharacterized protein
MTNRLVRKFIVVAFCTVLVPSLFGQEAVNRPPLITVTGTADMTVAPDQAYLSLGVDSRDKDLLLAKSENDTRIKKLMALAHAEGIEPKNIQTSRLSMRAEYSDEKIPKLTGYRVSQSVTLTLKDLSKYEDLMTKSLSAGVNQVGGIEFDVAHPEKLRDEARLKAIQAARDKAAAMAAQLGQKIGKAWEIKEGSNTGIFSPYANVQLTTRSRTSIDEEDATVSGGEVTVSASVTISFLLE